MRVRNYQTDNGWKMGRTQEKSDGQKHFVGGIKFKLRVPKLIETHFGETVKTNTLCRRKTLANKKKNKAYQMLKKNEQNQPFSNRNLYDLTKDFRFIPSL